MAWREKSITIGQSYTEDGNNWRKLLMLVKKKNELLAKRLLKYEKENHFLLHILQTSPSLLSFAYEKDGEIAAIASCGMDNGVFYVPDSWIFAQDEESFSALFAELSKQGWLDDRDISFRSKFEQTFRTMFPSAPITRDLMMYRKEGVGLELPAHKFSVVQMDENNHHSYSFSQELQQYIGSWKDFPKGTPLFGLLNDKQEVLCIADAMVQTQNFVSVQQLYTAEEHRQKGFGKIFLATVLQDWLPKGKQASYFLSESNIPSRKLAESVGFQEAHHYSFAKLGSS